VSLAKLLVPLDQLLRAERIDYALIGAYAAAAWGESRGTRDVDLLVRARDVERLAEALRRTGARFELRHGDDDDPIATVLRLDLGTEAETLQVDILAGIRGEAAGLLERVRLLETESLRLPVAAPEDMVLLKLLAGSVRDVEDAQGIIRVQGQALDRALLRSLAPPRLLPQLDRLLSD